MSESLKKAWSTVKREIKKVVVDFKEMSTEALEEMLENKTLNQDQVDFFIKCKEFIEKNKKI